MSESGNYQRPTMNAQKWFKFYGQEYLSDPKIERLTPTERSCWVTLMCLASLTEGRIRFLTTQSLLNKSGIQFDPYQPEEWEKSLSILQKFQDMEMIVCEEGGDILVVNWEKRQETNLTGAERVRNFRERQKIKETTESVTPHVTNVTQTDEESAEAKKVKFGLEDMQMAELLVQLITANNPEWTMRGSIDKWAEDIEKLHRIDLRSYEQIGYMIRWTQKDSFWCQNILSTKKLREKFNDLIPKIKAQHKKVEGNLNNVIFST